MARYTPGSQSRAIMAQKEAVAARLLQQGLSASQIATQLRCSPAFVRRVRTRLPVEVVTLAGVWKETA